MSQELIDLKRSIMEGRYDDALAIVDEWEWMSKEQILQKIESFLVRLLVHLIKNQVEQYLTNSWAASIRDSVLKIQRLNIKANKTSYYINIDEWERDLENAFKDAIFEASVEVKTGIYKPYQLRQIVDKVKIIDIANRLMNLTYNYSREDLRDVLDDEFYKLPGGEDWNFK
ncbi:MAG: DUF29 domain-containing protein [Okeania sp. SIO3H1]|uniref:DUF29 family protein n=1 Tax=Okeania sp. SIO1I7 TaxID=2607772 RepID=UPI0013C94271|nr:DUF29 family protein [Okeania sp. SIO1I7]NEN87797.1 DUF29 domain-containing protein [Okeania sp. SIO3H1]NET26953.1 DUF29 domain-containing protein [Okeania sp. SIO1I7]